LILTEIVRIYNIKVFKRFGHKIYNYKGNSIILLGGFDDKLNLRSDKNSKNDESTLQLSNSNLNSFSEKVNNMSFFNSNKDTTTNNNIINKNQDLIKTNLEDKSFNFIIQLKYNV